MIWTACRSGSVSQKAIYLTKGGLGFHVLETEKSAEVIVTDSNEPMSKSEDSQVREGPNIELCPDSDRNPSR